MPVYGPALAVSGKIIRAYDLIVAATALQRGSVLATFNRRHFSQVDGLNIIEPKWALGKQYLFKA